MEIVFNRSVTDKKLTRACSEIFHIMVVYINIHIYMYIKIEIIVN